MLLVFTLMFVAYTNCSEVSIRPKDRALTANEKGVVCTKTPKNLESLNRFIFLVDVSQSMSGVDGVDSASGTTRRVQGLRNLIEKFRQDDNFTVSIGALHNDLVGFLPDAGFTGTAVPTLSATCEFFKPRVDEQYQSLQGALDQLDYFTQNPQGTSPFKMMFSNAESCVENNLGSSSKSQYSVIVVTDGSPTDVTPQELQDLSRKLVQTGKININNSAEPSRVNLFFYFMNNFSGNPDGATAMYKAILAAQGAGGFGSRSVVADGDGPVDYDEIGVFVNRRYRLKHLAVTNMNASLEEDGRLGTDSDADGLTDSIELAIGYDPTNHSSNISCNDQIFLKNGGSCPSNCPEGRHLLDSDHDGLSDCDDFSLSTNPFDFDHDGDMIFDGLEKKIGSNPLDPDDFDLDMDLDGKNSFAESNQQTGVFTDDRSLGHKTLTNISLHEVKGVDGQRCYNVAISGIPIFPTKAVETNIPLPLQHAEGVNVIKLMFFQVSEDNPTAPPILQYSYRTLYYSDFESGQGNLNLSFTDQDFDIIVPSGF